MILRSANANTTTTTESPSQNKNRHTLSIHTKNNNSVMTLSNNKPTTKSAAEWQSALDWIFETFDPANYKDKNTTDLAAHIFSALRAEAEFDPNAEQYNKEECDVLAEQCWADARWKSGKSANTAPTDDTSYRDDDEDIWAPESELAMRTLLKKASAEILYDPQSTTRYLQLKDISPLWQDNGGTIPKIKKGYILPLTDELHTIVREFGLNNLYCKKKTKDGEEYTVKWKVSQTGLTRMIDAFPTKEGFNPHVSYYKKCADELPAALADNPKMPRYLEEIWPDIVDAVQGDEDVVAWEEAQWLVNWAGYHLIVGQIAKSTNVGYTTRETIILAGSQKRGKRTATRLLVPTYREMGIWDDAEIGAPFSEVEDISAEDKVLAEREEGMKIVGLPEIVGIHKKTLEGLKQYLSKPLMRYRKAYGRLAKTQYRTCIIVGKTNKPASAVPNDMTGNTRFVPLNIGKRSNDPEKILTAQKRRILFGVGWLLWNRTNKIHPTIPYNKMELLNKLAERHAAMSEQYSAIEEILNNAGILQKGEISTSEIKSTLRDMNTDAPSNNELADIMDRLGWINKRVRKDGIKKRMWKLKRVRKNKSNQSIQ